MRQVKVITTLTVICMMSVLYGGTVKAMKETVYEYSQAPLSDVHQELPEKYRQKKESAEHSDFGMDQPLADAVQMIYEKHYQDDPDSLSAPYCTYNAKGNFYAEVVDKNNSRIVLVYNGMSENGKCYLFVAEEEHFDTEGSMLDNTSLLEFYAVNLDEGEVYEAHKTTWGGVESQEYREATRE